MKQVEAIREARERDYERAAEQRRDGEITMGQYVDALLLVMNDRVELPCGCEWDDKKRVWVRECVQCPKGLVRPLKERDDEHVVR
jgi:hypothetical protein